MEERIAGMRAEISLENQEKYGFTYDQEPQSKPHQSAIKVEETQTEDLIETDSELSEGASRILKRKTKISKIKKTPVKRSFGREAKKGRDMPNEEGARLYS